MTAHIPFKYDFVGSFLRPEAVQNAKSLLKKGLISKEELTKVENTEIEKLIAKQKAAGYHVITDGEYRRAYWHLDFFWGLNGIEQTELSHGYFFHNEETAKGSIKLVGKITGENHPFVEHFKFVNQFATDKLRESTNSSIARAELEVNRINTNNIAQGNYIAEGYTNKNGTLTIVLQSQKADGSLENVATYDLGAKDIQNFRASAVVGADGYINFNAAGE